MVNEEAEWRRVDRYLDFGDEGECEFELGEEVRTHDHHRSQVHTVLKGCVW